jgi:basic amino acid/polyamine antiporter, APA family
MAKAMVRASVVPACEAAPALRRELGKWDLTAIGINQVIGSGVFILPSLVAAQVGAWSPLAALATGFASLLVALCFAEVGSRFEGTGGPYLYARAAFGQFVGFEVGWMQWFSRVTSYATGVNALVLALGFFWPVVTTGVWRASVIVCVVLALGWINLRGIKQSAIAVNLFTIAKLVPLATFIVVGVWFIDPSRLTPTDPVSVNQLFAGGLLLIFAFGGYDVIGVPAGEATRPREHLPFAFIATILAVTAVIALVQLVAMGTLPNLAAASTPLADASLLFMGTAGAVLIGAGAVFSMLGNQMGGVLTGSRTLFALAEHGALPRLFGTIHPRYRTPAIAILVTSLVSLGLALSGSFAMLAVASAIARLVTYIAVCAATIRLRHPSFHGALRSATFTIPLGAFVPLLAIGVSFSMFAGATRPQLLGGLGALMAGAALFAANQSFGRSQRLAYPNIRGGHVGAKTDVG